MESDQDIFGESERYRSYLQRLLWKPTSRHILYCGSFFELPLCYVISNLTDIDRMIINPTIIAIPRGVAFDRKFGEEILIIDTHETQTGFVRLLIEHYNNVSFFNIDRSKLHGPAYTFTLDGFEKLNESARIESSRKGRFDNMTQDEVVAIFCSFWPIEARDWITRPTLSGWPEEGIKDKIVRGGCHFVAKSHYTQPDDGTQWRYSFSQAEVVLINSWNDVQKYIYHILRVIKRRITKACQTEENSVFHTYLIKTLMLWACELNPEEFWAEEKIAATVEELLCQTIECLIDRKCPHYFISGLNILDCSPETDIISEVDELGNFRHREVSRIMAEYPKFDASVSLHMTASKKIIKHFSALAITDECINPLHPTFGRYNLSDEFSFGAWIYSELWNLFKGIMAHKQLKSLNSHTQNKVNITNTIEHFKRCFEEESNICLAAMVNLQESFHVNIGSIVSTSLSESEIFISSTTYCQKNSEHCEFKRKPFAPMFHFKLDQQYPSGSVHRHSKTTITHRHSKRVCCYERVSGNLGCQTANYEFAVLVVNALSMLVSSKVDEFFRNPSTVIGAAFCANFHYTYLQKYRLALDMCRKCFEIFEYGDDIYLFNRTYCIELFPVVLSSDMMPLFDENIQTVFGFIGLFICIGYRKELNRGNLIKIPPLFIEGPPTGEQQNRRKNCSWHSRVISSLVVQLCPAAFIVYIGVQCQKQLQLNCDIFFDIFRDLRDDTRLQRHSFLLRCASAIAQDRTNRSNSSSHPSK